MTALARPSARLEHRLTLPTASMTDLHIAVALAVKHDLAVLTVSPWLVGAARASLGRAGTRLATVTGAGHGGQIGAVKAYEASRALEHGARIIECVLNAGALLSGDDETVVRDLGSVIEMAHAALAEAGVVLEVQALPIEVLRHACRLAERVGADFVVTSDGEADPERAILLTAALHDGASHRMTITAAARFTEADQLRRALAAGANGISARFSDSLAGEAQAMQPVAVGAGEVQRGRR